MQTFHKRHRLRADALALVLGVNKDTYKFVMLIGNRAEEDAADDFTIQQNFVVFRGNHQPHLEAVGIVTWWPAGRAWCAIIYIAVKGAFADFCEDLCIPGLGFLKLYLH